ncbi:hypothetical protein [Burkholderia cepacia]|uniref:hypothetical protein n=1 Tax=Burkholderia cepacia TaxID=292 RepID=UPI00158ED3FE|nr:hypothetical protein [Burkholderia cepacia]
MTMPVPHEIPSHAAALDGLRHACHRQVVRHRHDVLVQMGFVIWTRQPTRLSQQVSARSRLVPAPIEVAELTPLGRSALDWLTGLEHRPRWAVLRELPYGLRRAPDTR